MKLFFGPAVLAWIATVAIAVHAPAADYSVLGYIYTSTGSASGCGQPVGNCKVEVWDEDDVWDDWCGTDYTAPGFGTFQVNFSMYLENPDVYVKVIYEFRVPDSRYVKVCVQGDTSPIVVSKPGGTRWDIPPGTTNLGTINLPDNRANIGTQAANCLWWVKSQAGSWWSMPHDMRAEALTGGGSVCPGNEILIAPGAYDTREEFSDIHHETGHFLHFNARGDSYPAGIGYDHYVYTQVNEGHAVTEAWAEWVASLSADPDDKNQVSYWGNNPPTWWRGQAWPTGGTTPPPAYTLNTGVDNAGDIVEGAMWRAWMSINDDFSVAFHALDTSNTGHFKQWLDAYAAAKSWNINGLLEALQKNGITYTRAKIEGFPESGPPDEAPASEGNKRVMNNVMWLRGKVTPTIAQNTRAELNLSSSSATVAAAQKKLGYKTAVAGLAQTCAPGDWTFLSAVAWALGITFDTTTVSDGEYDLVVQAENGHGWWDNFDPDFAGDATANRNSDEKWLKHLQTWYNQDSNPSNDAEGKVIIDNTRPQIRNRKPQ